MEQNSQKPQTESIFSVDTQHVGVLDGIRSLGVLIVLWFHFWQQTWLMPAYRTPFLNRLGNLKQSLGPNLRPNLRNR